VAERKRSHSVSARFPTRDLEVMKLLLAHGADPKISTLDGTTPLMALAGVGYAEGFMHDYGGLCESLEAMKLLIDCGIDVNASNSAKITRSARRCA
jgi:ankyrin repeat protein